MGLCVPSCQEYHKPTPPPRDNLVKTWDFEFWVVEINPLPQPPKHFGQEHGGNGCVEANRLHVVGVYPLVLYCIVTFAVHGIQMQ